MNLEDLVSGLARGAVSQGVEKIKKWLVDGTPIESTCRKHEELDGELLFCALARQLAYDCTGTPRVHVQFKEGGNMLKALKVISIPGTVVQINRRLTNLHGVCYVKNGANMKMMDGVKQFTSACFVASNEPSAVFMSRLAEGDETMVTEDLIDYAQDMQAVGALIHAAIGRKEVEIEEAGAENMREALVRYYRDLGVQDAKMDLGPVKTMARELAIWRAAERVLRGDVVEKELMVGGEE